MDRSDTGASTERELEERLRAVEAYYVQLFSEVSHDLRAPLGVILGALAELDSDDMPALDEEQRGLLTLARRSAAKLSRFAATLLELSRMDAGRFRLQRRDVDVSDLVRRALEEVGTAEQGHPAAIHTDLSEEIIRAHLDADRVVQALVNLVAHALRFARSRVDLRLWCDGDQLCIEVVNDGTSLEPSEVLASLEAAHVAVSNGGGSLGLALAGAIVRAHGGGVEVGTAARGGLRVACLLPRLPGAAS